MLNKIIYITLIVFAGAFTASAQRDTSLTQEVEVVKAFKPTISDANKINEMPKIDEAKPEKPTFNYSIYSQPILNTFSVNTLKAASAADEPKKETGYGLVRAGLGSYYKPYGEIFFNNLNSKKSIFGIHGKHLSSLGKINLEGGDRVEAPFSKNEAELYINHFFSKSVLSTNFNFNYDGFNYYGYPKDSIPAPLKTEGQTINYLGTKQAFTKGGFTIGLTNPDAEINDPLFNFNFKYDYFKTKTGQQEHFGDFTTNIQKPLNTGTVLVGASVTYTMAQDIMNRVSLIKGKRQQTWLLVKPAYYLGGKVAGIKAGFNAWYVSDSDFKAKVKIAPNVNFNFNPVKSIVKLYAGIDGNYINNHYSKIAYENPFVDPEHDVVSSFEKIRFYGGLDGKFSKKTNFKIGVDYSMIDDQPFYYLHEYVFNTPLINPNPLLVDNDFKVLYDDMKLMKFNLEFFHASSNKLDILLSGNYYAYQLNEQKEAWNMPDWDANLALNYKITEQLSVSADVYLLGDRKALIIETLFRDTNPVSSLPNPTTLKSYNLDMAFDLNVRGNYNITEKFSVFAQLNNFGFQKYERWFGYPVQSFNFLAGVSYAF